MDTMPPSTTDEHLPEELYSHLRDMNPKSFEFRRDMDALNELAQETGTKLLGVEDIFPPIEVVPPKGYESEIIIPKGAEIPTKQFEGVILSFASYEGPVVADLHRMVTDSNQAVNVVDLRPNMTASVKNGGPREIQRQEALDASFYGDLKFMLSNKGVPRRSVSGTARIVGYSRQGNNLERAYWMPISVNHSDGILTVARLGDSRTKPTERDLYRAMFGLTLKI